MLKEPEVPVVRDDFTYWINSKTSVSCRLYWTPGQDEGQNPGPAPIAPIAPEPPVVMYPAFHPSEYRNAKRLHEKLSYEQAIEKWMVDDQAHNFATIAYEAKKSVYRAKLSEYNAYIATKRENVVNGIPTPPPPPPEHPKPDMIFTHGRGLTLDVPAMVGFNLGFARTQTSLSFSAGKDTEDYRAGTFRSLHAAFPTKTFAGRSMGARACARASIYNENIRKLIFFTYPLVRGREKLFEELLRLPASVDVLFVVGSEDPRCPEIIMNEVRKRMKARSWWLKVIKGDHALWFDPEEKRLQICRVAGQIAAKWNVDGNRDPERTEMTLDWEGGDLDGKPRWTEWEKPEEDA